MLASKYCPDCGEERPAKEFHKNKRNKGGLASYCRMHTRQRYEQHYAHNAPARRTYQKRRREEQAEHTRRLQRLSKIKSKYGLDRDAYATLVAAADGRCAICGREKKLQIDHCHTTGKVRGLICWSCNIALGKMEDSVERLQAAIRYLQK